VRNRVIAGGVEERKYGTIQGQLLLFSFLLLTACLGGGEADTPATNPDPGPLSGEVLLSCSQICADRGQCGGHVDGYDVVLGGTQVPVVENHDVFFPAGVRAVVINNQLMQLQPVTNPQAFNQFFYQVEYNGVRGWVAGWCATAP
jgi:hypothetical protein